MRAIMVIARKRLVTLVSKGPGTATTKIFASSLVNADTAYGGHAYVQDTGPGLTHRQTRA